MSYVYYIRALAVLEIFLTISVRLIHFQQQPQRPPHLLRRVEAAAVASVTELVAGGNTAVVLIVM